jgi:hypothetical protein
VWRHWLAERTARGPESGEGEGESILWADTRKNVGLRFRVRENVDATRPVIVGSDEDVAVRYTLEYQGRPVLFSLLRDCPSGLLDVELPLSLMSPRWRDGHR